MAFTENFRQIEFNPDKEISETFRATQGDTKSQGFNVVVFLGGDKKVITTETMRFFAQKPDGTRVIDTAVKDGDGFKIELKNQVFAVPGVVVCTLVLNGASGEKLADRQFKILVAGSMEDGAIISEDERGILDRAFDLANDIVPRLEGLDVPLLENLEQEVTLARGTEPTLGARLDADKAELETKATKDYVDGQDALKADKTYTDEQLALKADSGEIETARGTEPTLGARLDASDAQLAEKVNKATLYKSINPYVDVVYEDCQREISEPINALTVPTQSGHMLMNDTTEAIATLTYTPTGIMKYSVARGVFSPILTVENIHSYPYVEMKYESLNVPYDSRELIIKYIDSNNYISCYVSRSANIDVCINGIKTTKASLAFSSQSIANNYETYNKINTVRAEYMKVHSNASPSEYVVCVYLNSEFMIAYPLTIEEYTLFNLSTKLGFAFKSPTDVLSFKAGRAI